MGTHSPTLTTHDAAHIAVVAQTSASDTTDSTETTKTNESHTADSPDTADTNETDPGSDTTADEEKSPDDPGRGPDTNDESTV